MRLDLVGVTKAYGSLRVLERRSASFEQGLNIVVGPSGSGKSTMLRLLASAERGDEGSITWRGRDIQSDIRSYRSVLGYAPQSVDLPNDVTAREFASYICGIKGLRWSRASDQLNYLAHRIGVHPSIDVRIGAWSGGMKRRLLLLQALLGSPEVVILDEPTAELDVEAASAVELVIRDAAERAVVVISTHHPERLDSGAARILRFGESS